MAIIIQAPNEVYSLENNENKKLFLAGGISNCPWWQNEMIDDLKNINGLTIYNPRREDFPIHDPNAAEEQITWEYQQLKKVDIISFWFARGSLNPIVLYELGKWGNSSSKPIFIGIDPEYERKQDVILQTKLSKGNYVNIEYNLLDLCKTIRSYLNNHNIY